MVQYGMPMRDARAEAVKSIRPGFAGLAIIQGRKRTRFGDDGAAGICTLGPSDRAVDLVPAVIALLLAGREPQCRVDALGCARRRRPRRAGRIDERALRTRRVYGAICAATRKAMRARLRSGGVQSAYYRIGGKDQPRPDIAAARHEVSCTLGDVVRVSASLLREGGRLALILPWTRREECGQTLARFGFQPQRFRPVVHQEGEPAGRFLLESVKGGADRCAALLPLIQYDAHGRFTAEMARIYHMDDEGRQ